MCRKTYNMEVNKIYNETCMETLSKIPDNFIDSVITSPPYWQLRDYNHPDQWGLEPTYQMYLEHLWQMMRELYRTLKPQGTVWINLGDTYNTKSGNMTQKNYSETINVCMNNSVIDKDTYTKAKDIKNKCLLLLPHRFAIGCIEQGWIIRNDIIWAKRNAMPESTTDRFSKKHEYMFFMTKQPKYFFNLDAVRDKHLWKDKDNLILKGKKCKTTGDTLADNINWVNRKRDKRYAILGKNPGSVADFWDIPTKPSKQKHFAAYNEKLITKPILAGSPENGIIYDPFMGTGSTAEAAIRANRQFIGSEINPEYIKIAIKRIKPLIDQTKLF